MFENLTDRLSRTMQRMRGHARLTEDNIQDAVREVRVALLEADVALPVVRSFVKRVRERAVGSEVLTSLSPGQALVKVVQDELISVMGGVSEGLDLKAAKPVVVLMAGLQGAGKTTTAAKLARRLIEREQKTVALVSCDVYRPAAIQQLATLAGQVGARFHASEAGEDPVAIVRRAHEQARKDFTDVLIIDSAGRLHIDDAMMDEIKRVHAAVSPHETLFVVDAMTGQDAVNSARAFDQALPLSGVILTKVDGDARGGAALSVRQVTGKPIKFLGVGEKSDALEVFHPDRIASRILGMGDVLSLVEEVEQKVDRKSAEKLARKISSGRGFNLADFQQQLAQMQEMGGLAGLLDKLPGMSQLPAGVKAQVDDSQVRRMVAMINSMTPGERRYPDLIKGSRKRRIAAGSGTQVQDVNRMLKQFQQTQRTMKKLSKGGMKRMMRSMAGRMPPGGFPQ